MESVLWQELYQAWEELENDSELEKKDCFQRDGSFKLTCQSFKAELD